MSMYVLTWINTFDLDLELALYAVLRFSNTLKGGLELFLFFWISPHTKLDIWVRSSRLLWGYVPYSIPCCLHVDIPLYSHSPVIYSDYIKGSEWKRRGNMYVWLIRVLKAHTEIFGVNLSISDIKCHYISLLLCQKLAFIWEESHHRNTGEKCFKKHVSENKTVQWNFDGNILLFIMFIWPFGFLCSNNRQVILSIYPEKVVCPQWMRMQLMTSPRRTSRSWGTSLLVFSHKPNDSWGYSRTLPAFWLEVGGSTISVLRSWILPSKSLHSCRKTSLQQGRDYSSMISMA